MSGEEGKQLVRRLADEVVNRRDLEALDEIASGQLARLARRWISSFRASFPDFTMRIVSLVGEGDTLVGHFACSGTHTGEWLGIPRPAAGSKTWTRSTSSRWPTASS